MKTVDEVTFSDKYHHTELKHAWDGKRCTCAASNCWRKLDSVYFGKSAETNTRIIYINNILRQGNTSVKPPNNINSWLVHLPSYSLEQLENSLLRRERTSPAPFLVQVWEANIVSLLQNYCILRNLKVFNYQEHLAKIKRSNREKLGSTGEMKVFEQGTK